MERRRARESALRDSVIRTDVGAATVCLRAAFFCRLSLRSESLSLSTGTTALPRPADCLLKMLRLLRLGWVSDRGIAEAFGGEGERRTSEWDPLDTRVLTVTDGRETLRFVLCEPCESLLDGGDALPSSSEYRDESSYDSPAGGARATIWTGKSTLVVGGEGSGVGGKADLTTSSASIFEGVGRCWRMCGEWDDGVRVVYAVGRPGKGRGLEGAVAAPGPAAAAQDGPGDG